MPHPLNRSVKRLATGLAIGTVLATSLLGCADPVDTVPGSSASPASTNEYGVQMDQTLHDAVPAQYKENGVKTAVYNDFAPDEFLENGELKGWSVDLSRAAAAKLGVELTYDPVSFEIILPGLQNKRFDLGVTSFSPLPERRKVLDFIGQRQDGGSYATKDTATFTISGPMDLCGHTVSAIAGGYESQLLDPISKDCTAAGKDPVKKQEYKTQSEAILAVDSGRAEVVTTGTTTLQYAIKQKNGGFTLSKWVNGVVYNSMGVRKGDPLGTSMVNAINALIADGTYTKIMEKWGVAEAGTIDKSVLLTEETKP
jgi:polar amino acid transport system substrate-binding protein